MESSFKYEDCLLKHHVRRDGWLPMCLHRLREMRSAFTPSFNRRLRYFTFCAVGAVDVLMLDLARVITRSTTGRFDTVFFFDKTPELVAETEKRIPGAVGFPGEFVDVVMASDPEEGDPLDALAPLELADDTESTRKLQMTLSMRRKFIQSFPFDVVNLDLERYLFRPKDPLPGKLVNTMRKVFEWQKRPFICEKK